MSRPFIDEPSFPLSHASFSRAGWSLLALLMVIAVLSVFLLHWYQNEIQFRLQAEVALQHQLLYQNLEGVLTQSLMVLQNFSEDELRKNSVIRDSIQFSSFFPQWSMHSFPLQDGSVLTVELENLSLGVPVSFEAQLYLNSFFLSDFPWIDSTSLPSFSIPENLIFFDEADEQLITEVPRFLLQPSTSSTSFDYVFHGNTEILWEQDQMMIFQEERKWELTDVLQEKLHIQIHGDVSIIGNMEHHAGKFVFLETSGDLSLRLPARAAEFSDASVSFFAHVAGRMHVQAGLADRVNVQVRGYYWIEEACPLLHAVLLGVYWKGSLACPWKRSEGWQVPLHLNYFPPSRVPPDVFARSALQLGGVRILNR